MIISYCICVHNESDTLEKLLSLLNDHKDKNDEIIILDDFSDNPQTLSILEKYKPYTQIIKHSLNKNYGAHKNEFGKYAKGKFLFQIDGDECPTETLILNIKDIIQSNSTTELFFVSRINDYVGVTNEHAKQWGWRLTPCSVCDDRLIVNHPDYQGRIFLNEPSRIRWDRRLHEKIEGHLKYSFIPADDYELALFHYKTIEKQLETNIRYNQWFTLEENMGHKVT
jgi:glycosyltransferase involved in cell wall biosynthesis